MFSPPPPGVDPVAHSDAVRRKCREGIYRRIVTDLGPKFINDPDQQVLARGSAVNAIMSFLPECDADWFNAADIVSFSLTSLDLLKDAATLDMSPAMKLRFVGRAIQASKMAREAETALQRRRKERQAMGPALIHRILDPVGIALPVSTQADPDDPEPPMDAAHRQALAEMTAQALRQLDELNAAIAASKAADDAPITPGAISPAPIDPGPLNPGAINPGAINPAPISPVPAHPAPIHSARVHPAQAHPAQAHPIQGHPTQPHPAGTVPNEPVVGRNGPNRPAGPATPESPRPSGVQPPSRPTSWPAAGNTAAARLRPETTPAQRHPPRQDQAPPAADGPGATSIRRTS